MKEYDFLVFTSANGVRAFLSRVQRLNKDIRFLNGIKLAAIGEMTAHVLREHFVYPEIVPETFTSKGLAGAFKKERMKGKRVLLIRSELANDILPERLKKMGACVDDVSAYTVREADVNPKQFKQLLACREIDLMSFTSPSTFHAFVSLMKGEPIAKLLKGVKVAAIGPVTKKAITGQGIKVAVTAARHTIPGLVDAILDHYQLRR
jgi:uroporphyrinogen III methyltransferase/synthase